MNKSLSVSLLLLVIASTVTNGQTTQKLSATKANDYAMVYTLPRTVVDITIVTRKTVETPGEFYQFAKRILNLDDPISEESTRYIIEKVIVNTHGEPDDSMRYAVKFSAGSTPYMILSPDNIPLAVNTDEQFKTVKNAIPEEERANATPLENPAARQVITEDMLRSNTSLKKAQSAAEQLYALRQSRTDLLTGQAEQMPPDGQSMQLILDNLNAQEAALMAMFAGTVKTSTQVHTISFTPKRGEEQIKDMVIARLSPIDGLVDSNDLSGSPIRLDYSVTKQGELPLNEKGVRLTFPKNGFAYCIPGKATIEVTYDGKILADTDITVAQAGIVYGLAPNSFTDKKAPMYLIFDPATGAAVEMGSK